MDFGGIRDNMAGGRLIEFLGLVPLLILTCLIIGCITVAIVAPILAVLITLLSVFCHSYRRVPHDGTNMFFYSIPNLYDDFVLSKRYNITLVRIRRRQGQ